MKETLLELIRLGITDTELEDGMEVRDLRVVPGQYPVACDGYIEAVVNGNPVRYPTRLECQGCGGCE